MNASNPPKPLTAAIVVAALELPTAAMVQQRVPKKMLVENGAPTAADKRLINDGIESIHWLASLKPVTVGVPAFIDGNHPQEREYLELAVLSVEMRETAKAARIAELVHRAIPYPVLLLLEHPDGLSLSIAHIRWSQNEKEKIVIDGPIAGIRLTENTPPFLLTPLLQAVSLTRLPRSDLFALVQGLIDTFTRFQTGELTGRFPEVGAPEAAAAQRAAIQRCIEIDKSIAELRGAAVKEKQLPRQVALNLEIKRLQAERAAALTALN